MGPMQLHGRNLMEALSAATVSFNGCHEALLLPRTVGFSSERFAEAGFKEMLRHMR